MHKRESKKASERDLTTNVPILTLYPPDPRDSLVLVHEQELPLRSEAVCVFEIPSLDDETRYSYVKRRSILKG